MCLIGRFAAVFVASGLFLFPEITGRVRVCQEEKGEEPDEEILELDPG